MDIELIIHALALIFYFLATIIVIRFWYQVKQEKYWIGLPLAVIFLLVHEIFELGSDLKLIDNEILVEVFEMLGALSLMISILLLTKVLISFDKIALDENENDLNEKI